MPAHKKTLVEDNGDIIYPQTTATAVMFDEDTDLESAISSKADKTELVKYIQKGDVESTDIRAGAVTTDSIAKSAITTDKLDSQSVTSDKIDYTTLPEGITSELDWSSFVKIGKTSVTYQGTGTSGGYTAVTFDKPFKNVPVVFAQCNLGNARVGMITVAAVTESGFSVLGRQDYNTSTTATIDWIAISPKG